MKGVTKSLGNFLEKDFPSTMSFPDSARFQAVYNASNKLIPPGVVVAWMEGYYTNASNGGYTSTQPTTYDDLIKYKKFNEFYVIADGTPCSNGQSIYFGKIIPNMTNDTFLMGTMGANVGNNGGSNNLREHVHPYSSTANLASYDGSTKGSHSHTTDNTWVTEYVRMGKHFFKYYKGGGLGDPFSNVFIHDDFGEREGTATFSVNGSHGHSVTFNISDSTTSFDFGHNHVVIPDPASYAGSGVITTSTSHLPNYLSCIYLFKVI